MFKKLMKSKTLIFMVLMAIVPALDLLGQLNLSELLAPIMCGEAPTPECMAEGPDKIYATYTLIVAGAASFLRFLTTGSLKDK